MSGTPIGDQVQTELGMEDTTPDAYEDWSLKDPDPVMNEDAADPLTDVPDGDDSDDELEDDEPPPGQTPGPLEGEPDPNANPRPDTP